MYRNRIFIFVLTVLLSCNFAFASDKPRQAKPVKITSADYEKQIGEGVVLVEFWAAWCSACRKLTPVLNQLAKEQENIKITKINADSDKPFALKMGIRTLPAMILYKDGKEVVRFSGFYPKEDLESIIANALKQDF